MNIRTNSQLTIHALAARTATPTAVTQLNNAGSGIHAQIKCTASADTPSVVPAIVGVDDLGNTVTLLTGAAITGASTIDLWVFPGVTAVANVAANYFLPRQWQITMTHADTDSITYSVAVDILR